VLEEIIVTAQKREQNLQDVPISILAIQGIEIEAGGVSDMEDMSIHSQFVHDRLTYRTKSGHVWHWDYGGKRRL
jgi:hypothetical protein